MKEAGPALPALITGGTVSPEDSITVLSTTHPTPRPLPHFQHSHHPLPSLIPFPALLYIKNAGAREGTPSIRTFLIDDCLIHFNKLSLSKMIPMAEGTSCLETLLGLHVNRWPGLDSKKWVYPWCLV